MNRFHRWIRWARGTAGVVGCALAILSAGEAQAEAVSVDFIGSGFAIPTGNTGPNDGLELAIESARYEFFVDSGTGQPWQLSATFTVEGLAIGRPGASRGTGMFFNGLGDEILFSFDGTFLGILDEGGALGPQITYQLAYDVTGGAGRYAGADGTGFELVGIFPAAGSYFEGGGTFDLVLPGTVPEPGTAALFGLAAIPLVSVAVRRRRRLATGAPMARGAT